MLNDVIGYTSYESFLDIHLLTDSNHKATKIFKVLMWIGIAIAMGYVIGLITALLCKYTGTTGQENDGNTNESLRDIDNTLYSTDFAVMFLAPWIAYLLAETLDMSAILTIFFCGLSLGQYAIHNLSPGCRQVGKADSLVHSEDLRSHLRDMRKHLFHLHRRVFLRLRNQRPQGREALLVGVDSCGADRFADRPSHQCLDLWRYSETDHWNSCQDNPQDHRLVLWTQRCHE